MNSLSPSSSIDDDVVDSMVLTYCRCASLLIEEAKDVEDDVGDGGRDDDAAAGDADESVVAKKVRARSTLM